MLEISWFYTSVLKTIIIWSIVPEIQSEAYRIFCRFEPFFALLPPNNREKSKLWKNEESIWRCHHFTHVYRKSQSYDVCFLRSGVQWTEFFVILDFLVEPDRHNFLSFWTTFCPFINNPKNHNFQKIKKIPGDIITSQMCTIRPQFVDTLLIVRLRPNMSMRRAVMINDYFLVHKMEVENLVLLSTQVLLQSNKVSLA